MEHRFEVQRRSRKEARALIVTIARHGNHYHGDLSTTQQLEGFLAHQGCSLTDLIEQCRDKEDAVPFLENLIPSTGWTMHGGPGVVMTYTDSEGNEVARIEGESGVMVQATSAALFEKAADDIEQAISKMSYVEFLSGIANGLASIESYLSQKAYQYNIRNPGDELVDDRRNKVSFEDKVKKWVPTMAEKKPDLSGKNWAHFQRLKKARDTEHTHSKSPALHITFRELCKLLNLFRSGIAGLLLDLYILFGDMVPSKIIKYAFHPEIKLVTLPEN